MVDRKTFLRTSGLAAAGLLLTPGALSAAVQPSRIRAVAFDGFPIFDPRPIFRTVRELAPEQADALIGLWKAKQFGYQWLRVAGGRYKDFMAVTRDALDHAVAATGAKLGPAEKDRIMEKYAAPDVWPDAGPALKTLREAGLKLCFLSNMTAEILNNGIRKAGFDGYFDHVISTDARKTYKPAPEAYEMGTEVLGLEKEEILFVAFAGWDVAGAKWFGYPTYWVNRLQAPPDVLDEKPDGEGNDLAGLLRFLEPGK